MTEIFWQSIASYNSATWPYQIAIVAVAAMLSVLLFMRPGKVFRVAMKVFLIFLCLWIAFVYYMYYGYARDYHYVMTIFWTLMAVAWLYDMATGHSDFRPAGRRSIFGIICLMLPLLYPVISLLRGMEPPAITTPVLPSSVAMFMLGILLAFPGKINFFAFLFIFHWAVVDISKIVLFAIPEDIILAVACIPAMIIFLRDYIGEQDRESKPSKPSIRLLITGVAMLITICLTVELCLN